MAFDKTKFVTAAVARCDANGREMLVNGLGMRGEVLRCLLWSIADALEETLGDDPLPPMKAPGETDREFAKRAAPPGVKLAHRLREGGKP